MHAPLTGRPPLRSRLPGWVAPLVLGVVCLFVYNANLRTIGAGDTLPARYMPLVLWHHGTFAFDRDARLVEHGHPLSEPAAAGSEGTPSYYDPPVYWLVRTSRASGRHLASPYPIVAPLLAAPLYLPAALWLDSHGWTQPQIDRVAEIMEKLAASLFAALASVLMFLVLRRDGRRWALPLALAFAFGTDTWMISSQALWQHGSGELLIALALLLAVARRSPSRTALLGCVCALIAANRPPDALIALAFAIHAIWRRPREIRWLLAGAALPAAGLLTYNLGFIGNIVGGYGRVGSEARNSFHVNLLGLPGLLISPGRGLLVFTPFLVFVPVGLRGRLRMPESRRLAILLTAAVGGQLLLYASGDWRAGESWGPRWLTDLLPILVWMLAPALTVLGPRLRGLLVTLVIAAVAIQAIGAFWYTRTSDERIFAGNPTSLSGAWDPANTPFVAELEHAPAGSELPCNLRGFIDRPVPAAAGALPVVRQGTLIEGWALACGHRSPSQVVLLIDGHALGETTQFLVRTDVNRTLHVHAATGWSVSASTVGIAAGRHMLQLAGRVTPRGDIRILVEEPVTVRPAPTLGALAAQAARQVRSDQARAGYWLTDFTAAPRYTAPQPEMNTYTTSVMTDLLTRAAPQVGLTDVVRRARRELGGQIEPSGLVRYHGLPNGPTIGTLGCVITPDADDTALAWRIAGRGRSDPRLGPMLRTLRRYRDARGLYRTWLAPQSRYQCLDPGRDPDPVDIGIQMHVLLMLRRLDPPAGRSLCAAIQRSSGQDGVWVYYAQAPLVPYLRSAELTRLGCRVPLPEARLDRSAPGQEYWSAAARLLVQAGNSGLGPAARQRARDLLRQLGNDDFALLRETPPLVFHNDLTANVRRFYWSRDVGYALWLRLYGVSSLASR